MATILVVEDNDLVRSSLRALLSRAGYDIHEASDGEESIDLFRRNQYELIVTDILLPKMSGIEVVEEMRRLSIDIPIVAMSGGGSLDRELLLREAAKVGANAVFGKPIENREFVGQINELLASKPRLSKAPAPAAAQ